VEIAFAKQETDVRGPEFKAYTEQNSGKEGLPMRLSSLKP